jgi:hypothetical protein
LGLLGGLLTQNVLTDDENWVAWRSMLITMLGGRV